MHTYIEREREREREMDAGLQALGLQGHEVRTRSTVYTFMTSTRQEWNVKHRKTPKPSETPKLLKTRNPTWTPNL